jgi:hypothetical protein
MIRTKKKNNFHRDVKFEENAVHKRSRECSRQAFGYSNNPVKIKINDFSRFFGANITKDAITREDAVMLAMNYPFIVNMLDKRVLPPPDVPILDDPATVAEYLRSSRLFRKKTPTVDRLSKAAVGTLAGDSTRLKFQLGISTAGCLHIGAGKVTASSVPDAATYVDWMLGTELFDHKPEDGQLLVSDAAVPNADGLGCGTYPALVDYLDSLAQQGHQIIAKTTLADLPFFTSHVTILHKPRPHNMEVIISMNIPGVGMSQNNIVSDSIANNAWRNQCCFEEDIPFIEDSIKFDYDLLHDPKDYERLLECVKEVRVPYRKRIRRRVADFDINKFGSLLDSGYLMHVENINLHLVKRAKAKMDAVETHAAFARLKQQEYTYIALDGTKHPFRGKRRANGRRPSDYPLMFWYEMFPSFGEVQLATFVNTMELLRRETVVFLKAQREIGWKDLLPVKKKK